MSGRDLLLEYAFPIEAIEPLAAPNAAYLNQACVVAKPKTGQEGNVGSIFECLNMIDVAARTDNVNAQQLFDGGLTKVYVLLSDDLALTTPLATASSFFTLLISDDFVDADISALAVGTWGGVVGVHSSDVTFLTAQALITNRTAFFGNVTNKAKNMFYAFGKLLSGRDWQNQQYIEMPVNDGIDDLSEAENLFDNKISFVLNSTEYQNRLALFTNNRKAIVAPYIYEWFQLSMQGWGVQYIALNQPKYTLREASLLQDFLDEKADARFVASEIVEVVTVKITLVEDNFIANGDLVISEPKALWRVNAKLQQGLI